jgi:hypothetical protein
MGRVGVALTLMATLASGCTAARSTAPESAPAALPASVLDRPPVIAPDQRVVAYPHGRWQLYGQGTSAAPFSWVWVPTGAAAPPPPAR